MDFGLNGKVAVVTGGGQGIGRAICHELSREGAVTVIADLDTAAAEKVNADIEGTGGISSNYYMDVTSWKSVDEAIKNVVREFGKIDILVNSAGIISVSDVLHLSEREWNRVFEVNAKGVFLCCKATLNYMIERYYGKIVNIASQAGKTGFAYEAHYSASKAAVIAFTQALAKEVAKYKINVNSVCPGSIITELNINMTEKMAALYGITVKEKNAQTILSTPLGRKGLPEDVANVVVYLASDKTGFMTGQAINITGGREFH
jgi:NAD(P)-dependent dehydrogenase (short-subunit alcohol dehydrogenase family)